MLTRQELTAFWVAPACAPLVAALLRGGASRWEVVAVLAYVAAFAFGAPLFALLRRRGHARVVCSLVSAAVAGALTGALAVILLLLGLSVPKFVANLESAAAIVALGSAWGLVLGLVSGLVLLALLRVRQLALAHV